MPKATPAAAEAASLLSGGTGTVWASRRGGTLSFYHHPPSIEFLDQGIDQVRKATPSDEE